MSKMLRSFLRKSPYVFYGTTIACLGVLGAVVATIIQNVTTGDWADFGSMMHRISMMTMLTGVIVIWLAVFYRRISPARSMRIQEARGRLWVSPIRKAECLNLRNQNSLEFLKSFPRNKRHSIQALLATDCDLDDDVFELLAEFPEIKVIDLQRSRFDEHSLDLLGELSDLQLLLVADAISSERLKSLRAILPEVSIRIDPIPLGFVDRPFQEEDLLHYETHEEQATS